jgi:hypothetical protein
MLKAFSQSALGELAKASAKDFEAMTSAKTVEIHSFKKDGD